MLEPARSRINKAQAALVGALVTGDPMPEGFDEFRVREAAGALLSKRARAVAQAWPRLATALGRDYQAQFSQYAMSTPLARAGPMADGRAFARTLEKQGMLPEEARLEIFAFDARHRICNGRITSRRLFFGAIFSRNPLRAIIAFRLPGLGERWIRLWS
jgi:hypothetical protein